MNRDESIHRQAPAPNGFWKLVGIVLFMLAIVGVMWAMAGCADLKPVVRVDPQLEARIATIEKTQSTRAGKTQLDNVKEAVVTNQQTALDALGVVSGDIAANKSEVVSHVQDVGKYTQYNGLGTLGLFVTILGPKILGLFRRRRERCRYPMTHAETIA